MVMFERECLMALIVAVLILHWLIHKATHPQPRRYLNTSKPRMRRLYAGYTGADADDLDGYLSNDVEGY